MSSGIVHYYLDNLPDFKNPVITIGSFDGVHDGHKAILSKVKYFAELLCGESVLITFEPHPRKIINPEKSLGLLNEPGKKNQLLLNEGIDHIVVVPFTRDFSMLSADEYVSDFLLKKINPTKIVIGYDHRFGHSREGDLLLMRKILPDRIEIEEISALLIDEAAISSTKIRRALMNGEVGKAAKMLGRYHSFKATVTHGQKIGRTIGFPTANLTITYSDILIPRNGVYAVKSIIGNTIKDGMLNIGYRPTVSNQKVLSIEIHIFNFDNDIYGHELEVHIVERIRDEQKFESIHALQSQLQQDKIQAQTILKSEKLLNIK